VKVLVEARVCERDNFVEKEKEEQEGKRRAGF